MTDDKNDAIIEADGTKASETTDMPKVTGVMRHDYLNAIGIKSDDPCVFNSIDETDDRLPRFLEERATHGFDSRETWSLDYTLSTWLYEHLKFYKEIASQTINMSYHRFDVVTTTIDGGEVLHATMEMTEGEAIDLACEYLRKSLVCGETDDLRRIEYARGALLVVVEILPALWW